MSCTLAVALLALLALLTLLALLLVAAPFLRLVAAHARSAPRPPHVVLASVAHTVLQLHKASAPHQPAVRRVAEAEERARATRGRRAVRRRGEGWRREPVAVKVR